MTIDQFLELKQLIEEELASIKASARADGVITSSPQFRNLLKQYKIRLLEDNDMTLDEYELFDAQFKEEDTKKRRQAVMTELDIDQKIGKTKEEIGGELTGGIGGVKEQLEEYKKQMEEMANSLVEKIAKESEMSQIDKEQMGEALLGEIKRESKNKEQTINSISQGLKKMIEESVRSVRGELIDISEEQRKIKGSIPKIPKYEKIDPKKLEEEIIKRIVYGEIYPLKKDIEILAKSGKEMPDWRKLGMGLQGQIDDFVSGKVDDETPSGTVNGTNTDFTLAFTPKGRIRLYVNGARQQLTGDYSISGNTITFVTAPPTGSIILCDYNK